MNNLTYLFAALAITWVGLWAYMYYLGQRVSELRRDVRAIAVERDRNPEGPGAIPRVGGS